ncbi:MAG: DUF1846 domain-containing protein [Promethearchaeota archaeon]
MKTPFNAKKYFKLQSAAIKERLFKFSGKLYFEIGGKFINDEHAARVLPGFDAHVKVKIIKDLSVPFEIIFCISSKDIKEGRVWKNGETYEQTILRKLDEISKIGFPKPFIVINLYEAEAKTVSFENLLAKKGYKLFRRYFIQDYPNNLKLIASKEGFGKDDYVKTSKKLILVIGAGSQSGKMSTCLGQVYHDTLQGIDSGYAKYETFPIWNLPLEHPINLAYEAATADIGDFNVYDQYHEKAYKKKAVNYNRDVEAFPIIKDILNRIISRNNYMRKYESPTDMGISNAGYCIEDDKAVRSAAIAEIKRRINEYGELVKTGMGKKEWVARCEELLDKAVEKSK